MDDDDNNGPTTNDERESVGENAVVASAHSSDSSGVDVTPNAALSNSDPMISGSHAPADSDEDDESTLADDDPKKPSGLRLQAKWEEMYQRLLKYYGLHGDCLVPNRYAEDPQLGSWVSTQRRHFKILMTGSGESTPMTSDRVQKLEALGFKWSTKDPRHVPWEQRYGELVDFKKRYGHAQVPIGWEDNVQLSNWVSTQRQEYKLIQRGRQSRLTKDRIALLDSVEFVWEAQRGGPRRKRKASVVMPSRAKPVHGVKVKKGIVVSSKRRTSAEREFREMRDAELAAPMEIPSSSLNSLGGGVQLLPAPLQSTGHWQVLSNGAFQQGQALPPQMPTAGGNQQLFPIASQWPVGPAGFQLGVMPIWAHVPPPIPPAHSGQQEFSSSRPYANPGDLTSRAKVVVGGAGEDPTSGPSAVARPTNAAAAPYSNKNADASQDDDEEEDFFDPES